MTETPVHFDDRAERDAQAAVEWYDQQQSGLGTQFIDALDATIDKISEHPRMYPTVHTGIRRALTEKFPYSVYYQVGDRGVTVLAVLHTRQLPDIFDDSTD